MTIAPFGANPLREQIDFATALADANLLPRAYQRQPANILLAMQQGNALGLPPAEAINSIHIIDGKPSMSADLMAALIRRAGHKLRITEEATPDGPRVTATLIRKDDPDFEFTVVWGRDKARAANLGGKGPWKNYEGQMMRARAITEVARQGASDVLHGVIYAPEELGANVDRGGEPIEPTFAQIATDTDVPALPSGAVSLADVVAEAERDWVAEVEAADLDALRALWHDAPEDVRELIAERAEALRADDEPEPELEQ